MLDKENNKNKFILALHSTNDYFGFGYKDLGNNYNDNFLIKPLDKDLSKNLVINLSDFLKEKQLHSIERISVSIGPANFNASRQIIVCARAIAQQINCSLDKFNSFQIMAKRIALKNNIFDNNQHFWIFRKLKTRGYIAGQYYILNEENNNSKFDIKETISPRLFKNLSEKENKFEAEDDIKLELEELLKLSLINHKHLIPNHWENVLPIYPIDPIN